MNKRIYLIILLLACRICNAQIPHWEWAKSAGGNSDEWAYTTTLDPAGNLYAAGIFGSPSVIFGTDTLTGGGAYIVKYDSQGNVIWTRTLGGSQAEVISGIATDAGGNLFITGEFNGATCIFDSISVNSLHLNYWNVFTAKYDSSGTPLWAKAAGGTSEDQSQGISVDANGNAYITGFVEGASMLFDTINLSSAGFTDIFTAKYDPFGNVLWAKRGGGTDEDYPVGISTDADGNSYITGQFRSQSVTFDSITIAQTGYHNFFLVKYDASGNVAWVRTAIEYNGGSAGNGVTTDAEGYVYVTGWVIGDSSVFGNYTVINTVHLQRDIIVIKYDSSGNVHWASSGSGADDDLGYEIDVDANGNSYVTGLYASTSLTLGSTVLTNPSSVGKYDAFVASFDSSGNAIWAKKFGRKKDEGAYSISVDVNNDIYVAGYFESDTIQLGSTILVNASPGNGDILIAKLSSTTTGTAEQPFSFDCINIFPNPFWDKITFTVENNELSEIIIYDIASRKLLEKTFFSAITLNAKQLAKGIYLYEVRNRNEVIKKGKVIHR